VRGNCLDLVLTNIPERISDVAEAGRLGQSDHDMILVTVEMGRKHEGPKRQALNWKKANWPLMRRDLSNVNWIEKLRSKTAEEMWTLFRAEISETVRENVPMKTMHNRQKPAWMTREIMAAVQRKKRLWQRAKHGRDVEDYKLAENLVKRLIRNAKRNFEKKLAYENGGNSRPFFAYIKKKTKSKPGIGPLKSAAGDTVSDDGGMAEVLNSFFSSVFTREDTGHIPTAEDMETDILDDVLVTHRAVRKKIQNLKTQSAAGPDDIGPKLLQELEKEVTPILVTLFNRSIKFGEVPEDWKTANVTPIFKKGSKSDPGNYRPVSLTSVCCRIMESVIRDELMHHLLSNNLLNQSQHGFMQGKSCTTNLLEFFDTVTRSVDEGKPFDVVFLDFAKAFDKVPRERLLEKLRAHGVRGRAWNWIKQWLTGRKQRVVLNGKCSSWADVLSGVPQGSVLGPILFLIFINDVDSAVEFINILRKFADDTKLGQPASTPEERELLQRAPDNLCEWAKKWGMEFNVKKCKVMHFGFNNPAQSYRMEDQQLEVTEEERDIGVSVTRTLKPSAQCAKAAKMAQSVLSQVSRAFHFRDRHIFLRLYIQYIRPHLEFAAAAWSPWHESDKDLLEKVQRRAVCMISGLQGKSYEEKLKELGITTLEERRHQSDMVQTYKILHGHDKVKSDTLFVRADQSNVQTRSATGPMNLRHQAARLEVRRNFFSQRVVENWNKVPTNIKMACTVNSFKRGYKKHRAELVVPT
jgi:hypothetical protein